MPFQSESASYGASVLPIITTKKIHLSSKEKTIKVDFSLNLPASAFGHHTVVNSDIAEMYYFYFVVLTEAQSGLIPLLKNPDTRGRAIKRNYLGHEDNIFQEGGIKRISYKEVLENHKTIQYNTTDLSDDYNNEFRSSTIVEYVPTHLVERHSIPYEDIETDKLCMVCFMDIDLVQDFSMGNNTIYYDLLLERSSSTGRLDVPRTINSFYVNHPGSSDDASVGAGESNIRPYYGPTHYHAPDPSNPEAYVGWMAGHIDGEMGPRLELVETPNYKITSDLKIYESQADISQPGHHGSIGPSWANDRLLPKSNLKNEIRHNNLVKDTNQLLEDARMHYAANALKVPNIVDYESQEMSFVNYVADPQSSDNRPMGHSHHGFAISIDFLEIVKHRSRLGYLLDVHSQNESENFIFESVFKSRIKHMSFFRQRAVNVPYEINERQGKIYSKYDENEYGDYIISSSDFAVFASIGGSGQNRILNATSDLGSLEEVEILQSAPPGMQGPEGIVMIPPPKHSRQFIVRDRDLFHNINYGKYTYTVKIVLEDGIEKTISDMLIRNNRILSNYEKFLFSASIPLNPSSDENSHEGGYDYATESFTLSFRSDLVNNQTASAICSLYGRMKAFLTGVEEQRLQPEVEELKRKLNLNSGKLQDFLQFNQILKEMNNMIKSILSLGVDITSPRPIENFKNSIENVNGANLKTIEIVAKTNIISEAISEGTIVEDFNPRPRILPNFLSFDDFRDSLGSVFDGGFILPTQFLTLVGSSYDSSSGGLTTAAPSKRDAELEKKSKSTTKKIPKPKGASNVVLNIKSYNRMSKVKKSNNNIKINFLLQSQSDSFDPESGVADSDRPMSYYPLASQRYFGGVAMGVSRGSLFNFRGNGSIRDLEEALDYTGSNLSEEVKKVICDSVYRQDDRDHFLEEIERRYEELSDLRDTLGSFYDFAHSLLTVNKSLLDFPNENISFQDKFEDNVTPSVDTGFVTSNIFKQRRRRPSLLCPGSQPRPINLMQTRLIPPPQMQYEEGIRRVVCIKMKEYNNTNTSVNDVVFLEV